MGLIERDPDAKRPLTDAMTWGERQRLWKDVYKRERDRFEQERDEAREQLRGAVSAEWAEQARGWLGLAQGAATPERAQEYIAKALHALGGQ